MSMFKGFISALLIAVLILSIVYSDSIVFAGNEIVVEIDDRQITFQDQQPVNVGGRILVPVRGVFERLGYTVDWEKSTGTATLSNGINTVVITIGKSAFTANGKTNNLDVPAQIINDRTMLPLRAVLESVGYNLDWDSSRNAVLIHSAFFEANGWSNFNVLGKPQNLLVILANYNNLEFKDDDAVAEKKWSKRIFGTYAENAAPTVNDYFKENSGDIFYWKPIYEAGNTTGVYSVHIDRDNPTYIKDRDSEWPDTLAEFYTGMNEAFKQLQSRGFDFSKYNFDRDYIDNFNMADTRVLWISPSFDYAVYIGDLTRDFPGGYEDYRKLSTPLYNGYTLSPNIDVLGRRIHYFYYHQLDVKGDFNQDNYMTPEALHLQPGCNPELIYTISRELAGSIGAVYLNCTGLYPESLMSIDTFTTHLDPYNKWLLNWYQPQEITINELQQGSKTVRLYPSASNNYNFLCIKLPDSAQYFLIENRRQLGFDASLDIEETTWGDIYERIWTVSGVDGIVIWRINSLDLLSEIWWPGTDASYRPSIIPIARPRIGDTANLTYYRNSKDKTDWNTVNSDIKIIPVQEYPDGSIDVKIIN